MASSQGQEASTSQTGPHPDVALMNSLGVPVTMENWLDLMYPDGAPDDWYLEADVPPELQDEFQAMHGDDLEAA